jgi:4-hydroxy-4-methyl-2-oxoglutarate aldolase
MSTLTTEQLSELARFDTPTVCNAIELFHVRPRNVGYMNRTIRAGFPTLPPMVGFAATATFRSQQPARQGDSYGGFEGQLAAFADLPGPPVVVFQDLDEPVAAATFGEVMCTTYQTFGAVGLITSGAGRDLNQVAALKFPVFTSGTICAHGYCHLPHIGVPVVVGGITIYPGDLLHGDVNGVTTIPLEIADEVPGICREIMDAEAIVIEYLKSPGRTIAGFSEVRKAFAAEIEQMTKRVRRNA